MYEKLINRVMQQLRLRRTEEPVSGDLDTFVEQFRPFITVSRDPGSGGRPIARMVAKKLTFRFYDEGIVADIAKNTKMRKSVLRAVDEKSRTLLDDFVHGLLNPDYVSEATYFRNLCKVILSVSYKGSVVIVGRGSNFIAPNAAGLHVRVTAPYRVRVQRAVQYEGHSLAEARQVISNIERERREFVQQYFGKDIHNPKYFDLVINTEFFTIQQATELIIRAFQLKFGKRR